ncbi:hypothetical protein [Bacillus phage vB_BanS-Thrax2]|nr:hypothetical protein [Bacillus phage vB_BanS-Thrax2]
MIRYREVIIDEILTAHVTELSYGFQGCVKVYWVHCHPIIDAIHCELSGKTTGKGVKNNLQVIMDAIHLMKSKKPRRLKALHQRGNVVYLDRWEDDK